MRTVRNGPGKGGNSMTLDQGIAGHTYIVETLNLAPRIEKRLQALGMIVSTPVDVLNNKNGGTMIIKVRNTRLAFGRGISSRIVVRS